MVKIVLVHRQSESPQNGLSVRIAMINTSYIIQNVFQE